MEVLVPHFLLGAVKRLRSLRCVVVLELKIVRKNRSDEWNRPEE
jgi:hypothetical protein